MCVLLCVAEHSFAATTLALVCLCSPILMQTHRYKAAPQGRLTCKNHQQCEIYSASIIVCRWLGAFSASRRGVWIRCAPRGLTSHTTKHPLHVCVSNPRESAPSWVIIDVNLSRFSVQTAQLTKWIQNISRWSYGASTKEMFPQPRHQPSYIVLYICADSRCPSESIFKTDAPENGKQHPAFGRLNLTPQSVNVRRRIRGEFRFATHRLVPQIGLGVRVNLIQP